MKGNSIDNEVGEQKLSFPPLILADVSAIREKGLAFYQENYFWPVPDDEHRKFVQLMHDTFVDLILSLEDENAFDIALIDYPFIVTILEGTFHYNYVQEYARVHDLEVIAGEESNSFRNPDWESISSHYKRLDFPFGKGKRVVRRFVKNILFNNHVSVWQVIKVLFGNADTIGIGSYDILKKEFIQNKEYSCDHRDWIDFLIHKNKKCSEDSKDWVQIIINDVVDPFLERLQEQGGMFVKNMNFEEIQAVWVCRFSDAALLYESLLRMEKPQRLLVTETAKPHSRLISIAFQRCGCEVYGFHHGNDTGFKVTQISNQYVRSHFKRFVVPTAGIAKSFSEIYGDNRLQMRIGTQYFSADSSLYKGVFKKSSDVINSKPLKKIMLMGTPANPNRYIHERGQFFYIKIDLEIRIIRFLKNAGYDVIYKAHPERLDEINGLFNGLADEVNTEPFEKEWEKADAFVFTDAQSSTFGFALSTRLPLFYLDNDSGNNNPLLLELLAKRVKFVPMFLGPNIQMMFDEDKFLTFLKEPTQEVDFSFVKEMFF